MIYDKQKFNIDDLKQLSSSLREKEIKQNTVKGVIFGGNNDNF